MAAHEVSLNWMQINIAYPKARVTQLQRLGVTADGRGLDCDGKVGPVTRGARYLNPELFFAAKELHEAHPELTPNERAQLTKEKLGHFIHPIAVSAFLDAWNEEGETLSNNRGPYVSALYEDDNPEAQQGPWCAVQSRRSIRAAYPDALPNPRHAWMAKGLAQRMKRVTAPRLIRSGDQITHDRFVKGTYNNANGHAVTCVAVDGDDVWTVEGNVDVSRARDGKPSLDGVAVRRYKISEGLRSSTGAALHQVSRWPEPPKK